MTENRKSDPQRVVTPKFRVSFANVLRPRPADEPGKKDKYGLTMLFPKGADLSALKAAAKAAAVAEYGPNKEDWPPNLRLPFRDQGEKVLTDKTTGHVIKDENGKPKLMDGYVAGAFFSSATTTTKPGLVDQDTNPILDESEFYSGCYARASIRAFHYNVRGNVGIGFGLDNIQKLADGEPLGGGKPKPEDDFSPAGDEPIGGDDLGDTAAAGGQTTADMLD